uniref:Ionotropic glutamate receptor L-glutamate and glycine-binding domain-containing protein n=1 Tax=Anopheles coluzzii TaxID=1518534 RepID=A0A6E8W9Y8_ANOCL
MKLLPLFCILLYHQVFADYRDREVVKFVANVTHTLAARRTGTFICWLLLFSIESSSEQLYGDLSKELSVGEQVTTLQADYTKNYDATYPSPNVVTIFAGALNQKLNDEHLINWLEAIPVECFVILTFKQTSVKLVPQTAAAFAGYAVVNFIMIAVNEDVVYSFHYMPLQTYSTMGFPAPHIVLYDRLGLLQLNEISGAYFQDAYAYPLADMMARVDNKLFALFFQTLGIRFKTQPASCNASVSFSKCLDLQNNTDIFINQYFAHQLNDQLIDSIEMQRFGLFIPNGRPLSIVEIFILPFDANVWLLIGILYLVYYVVHHFAPTLFQNNIILLAVFGWEKHTLRLTERCEKLCTLAIIVLFFQLQCAYETIVISSLINRPTKPIPQTIQDVRKQNMKVLYDANILNLKHFDMNLEGIVLNSGIHYVDQENTAFLCNLFSLELLSMDVTNVDITDPGRPRHVILKQTLWQSVAFYYFRKKSIFAQRFARFRRLAFEAGLQQQWKHELIMYFKRKRDMLYHQTIDRDRHILNIDNMDPIFKLFLVQWGAALFVFICEICVFWLKNHAQRLLVAWYRRQIERLNNMLWIMSH